MIYLFSVVCVLIFLFGIGVYKKRTRPTINKYQSFCLANKLTEFVEQNPNPSMDELSTIVESVCREFDIDMYGSTSGKRHTINKQQSYMFVSGLRHIILHWQSPSVREMGEWIEYACFDSDISIHPFYVHDTKRLRALPTPFPHRRRKRTDGRLLGPSL